MIARSTEDGHQPPLGIEEVEVGDDASCIAAPHANGRARQLRAWFDQPRLSEADWQVKAPFILPFPEQENEAVKAGIEARGVQAESRISSIRRQLDIDNAFAD